MPDDYQPVSCQLHSDIELHAMQGNKVVIKTATADNLLQGVIVDVIIRDRAEYAIVQIKNTQTTAIRLDQIQSISLS